MACGGHERIEVGGSYLNCLVSGGRRDPDGAPDLVYIDPAGLASAGVLLEAEKNEFFDRAADIAEIPSAPLRYRLPGRVLVDLIRPADSLEPGETPAQEAR